MLRTVRHLRFSQLAHRLHYRARRAIWERRSEATDARYRQRAAELCLPRFDHPGLLRLAELYCGRTSAETSLRRARDALEGRFEFLNVKREFAREVDWYRADLDQGTRLWKTQLHEFPYAVDLARAHAQSGDAVFRKRFFELARSWREASPIGRPGFALDCWNARAVARRLVSWAVAGSLLRLEQGDPDADFLGRELAVHALFLADNLEWDLRANHLLSDLTALTSANVLLGCAPAAQELLRQQLDEQILADGCHEERVPLYHAMALQELVEARAVLGSEAPSWLSEQIARMAAFLSELLPEDGRLPLLGDSFHGEIDVWRVLEEAEAAGRAPEPRVVAGASGLVVLRAGHAHLVVRGGAHGPDHQLGHAHADGLSFELSVGPERVVTDTGTPTYDPGPARERARSTAAHNTVQVDGEEQIEAWGSFRVARRSRGWVEGLGDFEGLRWLQLAHAGWRWLPGRPLHRRLLALGESALLVLDTVQGGGEHVLRSALHLHPDRPAGARAYPLGGSAAAIAAPLHERFNETREATEVFQETNAQLPWVGGWLVLFDAGTQAPDIELRAEEGVSFVRCRHPSFNWQLRWRPGAAQMPDSVEFSRCSASDPSAT